jgi:hypothetical protein
VPKISTFSSSLETQNRNKHGNSANKGKSAESESEKQSLMSLFEINIIRYELFIENIRAENIDPFFMIDFMSLPENYFLEDAVLKYGELFFVFKALEEDTKINLSSSN